MKLLKVMLFSGGMLMHIHLYPQSLKQELLNTPVTYVSLDKGEEYVSRDLSMMLTAFAAKANPEFHDANAEVHWRKFYSRPHPSVKTLKTFFKDASDEFGVPQNLLEAIGVAENNWTQVGPSIDRGWGIMHLVDNEYCNTLNEAAFLLGIDTELIKDDARQNIRAAAALIAFYAGPDRFEFTKTEDWFIAVAKFSGLINEELRIKQAATYYNILKYGIVNETLWDEIIEIKPINSIDVSSYINSEKNNYKGPNTVEYGPAIAGFIPCNYSSGRSHTIDTWVHHWIGVGTYAGTLSWFNNCSAQASTHFVIRSSDGEITQCVSVANTAWHCGASGYPNNSRSIGVEHEATSSNPGLWNDPDMLQASANMVCHFAGIYNIPPVFHSSPGICGHNEMPGTNTACPGPLPWTTWGNLFNTCFGLVQGPSNLSAEMSACPSGNVKFKWDNSGSGWFIAVSTDFDFGQYYWKWVSGLTWYNGPTGFVDRVDGLSPLVFQNGMKYYWKMWDGNNFTAISSFMIPRCDSISPVVTVTPFLQWQTNDFDMHFSDSDNINGSGISEKFYMASDYNGLNWTANYNEGFLFEKFENSLPVYWINPVFGGTWTTNSSVLQQTDVSVSNSILSVPLIQNNNNVFLYECELFISSSGSEKKAGMYFFASKAAEIERGDSYFVEINALNNKVYIRKSVSNDSKIKQIAPYQFNTDCWYNIKILYKPVNGLILVYIDDKLACSWIDAAPITNGDFLSLRTNNSKVSFDDIKVYKNRPASVLVKVGTSSGDYLRYQSVSPLSMAGFVAAINIDNKHNWSQAAEAYIKIDWTPPSVVTVNDGIPGDIDTLHYNNILSACWTNSFDANSGILKYMSCIGTSPGDSNTYGWADNGINVSNVFNTAVLNQGSVYYVSVKAINNAGLYSISTSNGVFINNQLNEVGGIDNENNVLLGKLKIYPNPAENYVKIETPEDEMIREVRFYDISGRKLNINTDDFQIIHSSKWILNLSRLGFSSGVYFIECITAKGQFKVKLLKR